MKTDLCIVILLLYSVISATRVRAPKRGLGCDTQRDLVFGNPHPPVETIFHRSLAILNIFFLNKLATRFRKVVYIYYILCSDVQTESRRFPARFLISASLTSVRRTADAMRYIRRHHLF